MVILDKDLEVTRKNAESLIDDLMAPYSEHLETEPRNEPMDEEDVLRMAQHYGIDMSKPDFKEKILEKMEEWHGQEGGFDNENGQFYRTTTYNPKSKWDWYVIGGRWTGYFSGYEPDKDPANLETCFLCKGTGIRDDWATVVKGKKKYKDEWAKKCHGCNGCNGKGKSLKFSFGNHDGDVLRVRDIKNPEKNATFAVVLPDGQWVEKGEMGWWGVSSPHDMPPAPPMLKGQSGDEYRASPAFQKWREEVQKMEAKQGKSWQKAYMEILKKYQDYWAVLVDCHI
jgi:hypothetical protein